MKLKDVKMSIRCKSKQKIDTLLRCHLEGNLMFFRVSGVLKQEFVISSYHSHANYISKNKTN